MKNTWWRWLQFLCKLKILPFSCRNLVACSTSSGSLNNVPDLSIILCMVFNLKKKKKLSRVVKFVKKGRGTFFSIIFSLITLISIPWYIVLANWNIEFWNWFCNHSVSFKVWIFQEQLSYLVDSQGRSCLYTSTKVHTHHFCYLFWNGK